MSKLDLVTWSREFLAQLLDRPVAEIDPDASFAELGLDSAKSTQFVLSLEDRLGLELDPTVVESYPSIAALAEHLGAQDSSRTG